MASTLRSSLQARTSQTPRYFITCLHPHNLTALEVYHMVCGIRFPVESPSVYPFPEQMDGGWLRMEVGIAQGKGMRGDEKMGPSLHPHQHFMN